MSPRGSNRPNQILVRWGLFDPFIIKYNFIREKSNSPRTKVYENKTSVKPA